MTDNISIWLPKHLIDGNKNLDDFIAFARDELTLYADQEDDYGKGWDAGKWKTTHAKPKAIVFGYSAHAYKIDRQFELPFIDFAKAFIRQNQTILEAKSVGDWISVFRVLHDVFVPS